MKDRVLNESYFLQSSKLLDDVLYKEGNSLCDPLCLTKQVIKLIELNRKLLELNRK